MSNSHRYTDLERSLMATAIENLGISGTQKFLSGDAPAASTLRKIASEYNVTPAVPTRPRKDVKPKTTNSNRGRRYTDEQKAEIAEVIRTEGGLTQAISFYEANNETPPSIVTLHKIAKSNQIELHRGRPTKNEVEVSEAA